jgi:hypothetical protein
MSEATDHTDARESKGYTSERGPFAINANPSIKPPIPREAIDVEKAADGFAHEPLVEKYGDESARNAIGEMVKAFIPGTSTTPLFAQGGPHGMSLVHVWFGPNFPLFRHSHPRYGDCLYYVIAGEITMGNRTLGAGSTFFLPNGQPYKYSAGPAGVELLEFRAGGGEKGAPGMKLDERSIESIEKITTGAYANEENWQVPARMGDTAVRQAQIDGRLPSTTELGEP